MKDIKKVIDISKWNIVDVNKIKEDIDGVIIRCGFRGKTTGVINVDPLFKKYITEFYNNGVPVGVYFFTTAINEQEAIEEANYSIKCWKELNIELSFPIVIDTEYVDSNHTGRSDSLSKEDRTKVVVSFCEHIIKQGYEPCIYASDSWFKYNLEYDKVKKYKKWVADYSDKPSIVKDNMIGWQYGQEKMNGSSGSIDQNEWYDIIINKSKVSDNIKIENRSEIEDGTVITLDEINLYRNSITDKVSAKKSGKFYIWSKIVKNGRVRITNKPESVRRNGDITGWINISDIK